MILLFSGGLDSFIAYHYLNKPKTLYVNLQHRYAVHEIEKVKELIPDTIIDDRLFLGDWEEKDANIPLRNAFLTMIASNHADDIVLVVQRGEMEIPDRSPFFFNNFAEHLSFLHGKRITLTSPFFTMTKTDMVKWYLDGGLDPNILLKTRSCYSPTDKPCGNCSACFRRWVAFFNNDIHETMEQAIEYFDGLKKYVDKLERGMYEKRRTDETLLALKKAGKI